MTDEEINDIENNIVENIRLLNEQHQRYMKPFYDQLLHIRSFRRPVYKISVCPICKDIPCTCQSGGWK